MFVGDFVLQSARTVASDLDRDDEDALVVIDGLVAKSLISTATIDGSIWYRLADTTRSYALKKLEESGERDRLARRHAEYYRDLLQRAEAELGARPISEWVAEHKPRLDNLRAALDWAFFPARATHRSGVALTAAAGAVTMDAVVAAGGMPRPSGEGRLAALGPGTNRDARREMKTPCHARRIAQIYWRRRFQDRRSLDKGP